MKKKILVSVIVIAALFWAKSYFYDYKINHNLKIKNPIPVLNED